MSSSKNSPKTVGTLVDRLGYRMREAHDSFINAPHAMRTQALVNDIDSEVDTLTPQADLLQAQAGNSDFGLINEANRVTVLGSLKQSYKLRYSLTRKEALCRMAGRSRALAPAVRYLCFPWERKAAESIE